MASFWHNLPKPFFILAPMEAVTDVVFRHVIAEAGAPDVWFTEFTNATGWAHAGDKALGGRLVKTEDENPIVAQLWGSDSSAMSSLAQHCAKLGYQGIDINMGCPDQSAIKSGGGAGMIRDPENASEIILAAKNGGLPVSVKTRLGYSSVDEWHDWISHILRQDIVNLTVHLRTKKEMSKVPAHFDIVPYIIQLRNEIAPQTLITINGDICDKDHGLELYKKFDVDGIMIGRGIFTNPYAFVGNHVDSINKIELLYRHLDLYDIYQIQTGRPFDTLKRFFKIYVRDFPDSADVRDRLMHAENTDEVRAILRAYRTSSA